MESGGPTGGEVKRDAALTALDMQFSVQPVLAIGVSILVGGAGGVLVSRGAKAGVSTTVVVGGTSEFSVERELKVEPQNVSVDVGFSGFTLEKQKDVLLRLKAKYGDTYPANMQVALARLTRGLSVEQTIELLEALPKGKEGDRFVRQFLIEHIASLDPPRALELGRKLKDNLLLARTMSVVAQKSGPEALRILETMPEAERSTALGWQGLGGDGTRFNGSIGDIAELLRRNPAFGTDWENGKNGISRLMGKVVGQASGDPAGALAEVRDLALDLVKKKSPAQDAEELQKRVDGILSQVTDGAFRGLLEKSPAAASAFLDGLPETQKTAWMSSMEASSRFKTQGVEAAIQFAEKQGTEESMQFAAGTTLAELAQKDRGAALQWVEALPEGAFRQGALLGVMMDSVKHNNDQSGLQEMIAGASVLGSSAAQVDYYSELIKVSGKGWMGQSALTPSQLIAVLPASAEQKQELYRRFAPIKP